MKSCMLNGHSSFASLSITPKVMIIICSTDPILHLQDMSLLFSMQAQVMRGQRHVSEDRAAPFCRRGSNIRTFLFLLF